MQKELFQKDFTSKIFHENKKSIITTSLLKNKNYNDVLLEALVENWVRYD